MPIVIGLAAGVLAALGFGAVLTRLGNLGYIEMTLIAAVGLAVGILAGVGEAHRRRRLM